MSLFRSLGATMVSALVLFAPFDATHSTATAATRPLVADATCFDPVACLRNRLDPRSMAAGRRAAPRVDLGSASNPERNVNVLYAWAGGLDGSEPGGTPVAFGGAGYGVTHFGGGTGCGGNGCGTIFKLTPPRPGETAWTHSVIHAFNGAGGSFPNGIIADNAGALYGTTFQGGGVCNCGVVFRLTPPAIGAATWKYSVLHTFTFDVTEEGEGNSPSGGLVFDKTGALYGTTFSAVFKLTPPRTGGFTWTSSTLHRFAASSADGFFPNSDLIMDKNGALYGTTYSGLGGTGCFGFGCGTVYRLTPPAAGGTAWTETLLHVFTDNGGQIPIGVTADRLGALYVTTLEGGVQNCYGGTCGSVYRLTAPPSGNGTWNAQPLHFFTGLPNDGGYPNARVIVDSTGTVYGTTLYGGTRNQGTVFKLLPPSRGNGSWTQHILHSFNGGADGSHPSSQLLELGFKLYSFTWNGGRSDTACPAGSGSASASGCGVAFTLAK